MLINKLSSLGNKRLVDFDGLHRFNASSRGEVLFKSSPDAVVHFGSGESLVPALPGNSSNGR